MASEITVYDSTGNPQSLDGDTIANDFNAVGVGQTWQDMTTQRALNTDYTNDTGRPIQVSARLHTGSNSTINEGYIYVDGMNISGFFYNITDQYPRGTVQAIVPAGSTYRVGNTQSDRCSLGAWAELRS